MKKGEPKQKAIRKAQERIQRLLRGAGTAQKKMQAARDAQNRRYKGMRGALRESGAHAALTCRMLLHRIVLTAEYTPRNVFLKEWLGKIPGIQLGHPRQLWHQLYGFVRRINGLAFLSSGSVEFAPTNGYTPQFRITLVPRSEPGFSRRDLETIIHCLPNFKFSVVELAWDFPIQSSMDAKFVERAGVFGKSLALKVGINPMHASWGSRRAGKFVRAYARPETNVFRVEVETHARLLRHLRINDEADLPRLVQALVDKHIAFMRLDEDKLRLRLANKGMFGGNIVEQVRDKSSNLGEVLRYLRQRVHLTNVQRLCSPDPIDRVVREAAQRWMKRWSEQDVQEGGDE